MVNFNVTPKLQWPVDEQAQFPKSKLDLDPPKVELTREQFEELVGFKVLDYQWAWVKSFANNEISSRHISGGRRGGRHAILEIMDEREPGEAFCSNCPDHEGCMQGLPCSMVKRVDREAREE